MELPKFKPNLSIMAFSGLKIPFLTENLFEQTVTVVTYKDLIASRSVIVLYYLR